MVPFSEESVEVSDVILRASDLARALKLTERSPKEYGERMEAQTIGTVRDGVDREGEDRGGVFVANEIASTDEEKAAAAEAASRREEEEELRRHNEIERRMEEAAEAAADLERRMEAVFVAYEIASAEEEK